jgi:ATP-dependent Lon protease
MEVIRFSGYIEEEKIKIAEQFLVPKQLKENGLTYKHLRFSTGSLQALCRYYTREAGVRNLEREVAGICRKVAKQVADGNGKSARVSANSLEKYVGARRFIHGLPEKRDEVAVATGLTYTEHGGDILSVEVTLTEGKGELNLTGQMGDVMKESAQAALTYTRSRARQLGIDAKAFEKTDIHIHVPAGAIPKEGPSAGITMASALISAFSRRPVRRDLAMTGEVTLRGKVLPVGGIREKILAAHRAGIPRVILPDENAKDLKDLDELPTDVRRDVEFIFVEHMDQVVDYALLPRA